MGQGRGARVALGIVVALGTACENRQAIAVADGELAVDRQKLDFGVVELHAKAIRHVKVVNVGMAAMQLVAVGAVGPDQDQFHGSALLGQQLFSDQEATVDVVYDPSRTGGATAQLDVLGQGANQQSLAVELSGTGVDAEATISPSQLDYGKVEDQSSRTRLISVENDSLLSTRVILAAAGPDAARIAVEPPLIELPAGARVSVGVTWTPAQTGTLNAWLIALPCPWCQAMRIDLTGQGIPDELIAVPGSLNFGSIPKDFSVQRTVMLENVGDHALTVETIGLAPGSSGDFAVLPGALPFSLQPGGSAKVAVSYLTTSLQAASGAMQVTSTDPGHPELLVPLTGGVGGALLAVAPSAVDFGVVPLGAKPMISLVLQNQGSQQDLVISSVTLTGAPQFTIDLGPVGGPGHAITLHPQQQQELPVYFEPTDTTQVVGQIAILSNDPIFPTMDVAVLGEARTTQPCVLQLLPPAIDFGSIPVGSGAVLAFHAVDVGPDVCVFRHIRIDPASDPGFALPGGEVDSFVIDPGEFAQAQVSYRAATAGGAQGAVIFTINDPSQPDQRLPLTALGDQPCLTASPAWLDFGPVTPGCGAGLDLSTQITNACAHPVNVSKIWVGPGTTTDFAIAAAPTIPLALPAGAWVDVTVHYAAQDEGMQASPLFLQGDDVPRPILVPLLGERLASSRQVDDFRQQSAVREDVLFVMANTGSMRTKLPAIVSAVPSFADSLQGSGLDYHVGVTTTGLSPGPDTLWQCPGGAEGGEAGRLFPVDGSAPRILDDTISDLAEALEQNLEVGYCHYYQQGLEAMRLALTPPLSTSAKAPGTPQPNDGNLGFLRDDASLALVFLSDDNDYSGLPETDYLQTIRLLSGWGTQRRVSASAIVDVSGCPQDTLIGQRYIDVAKATGGVVSDLCAPDLSGAFQALGAQATALQRAFVLSTRPQPATIQVTVDGGASTNWSYDPVQNAVVFPSGGAPPSGSLVEVTYLAICQ